MNTRIDLIRRFAKVYSYETYLTNKLKNAFAKLGIFCETHVLHEGLFNTYLKEIEQDPPALTISFVNLFPGEPPLCEITRIPHICWPREYLTEGFPLLQSPLGHIGVGDRSLKLQMKREGYQNVTFLAKGVDPDMEGLPDNERLFDVVLFEDLIDPHALQGTWKELFSPLEQEMIWETIERCKETSMSVFEALMGILKEKQIPMNRVSFCDLLFSAEEYLKTLHTIDRIQRLENTRIDIFGQHVGNNWLSHLKNKDSVFLHWSLPYIEHFEVLKRSKMFLSHSLPGTDGDEWALSALSLGCGVLSNRCPFLEEAIEEDLFFYDTLEQMPGKVHDLLENASLRLDAIQQWKETLLAEHTWVKRAEALLSYFQERSA